MRKYLNTLRDIAKKEMPHSFPGLDGVKGLLIFMVVLTHCLPSSTFIYFMYFFHMPLFMAISGFLVKVSTFKEGFSGYFKRMWFRLIIPWIIARLIFLPLRIHWGNPMSWPDLIYPYYHLWYIPAYLIAAFLCYAILRWKVPVWLLLLVTMAFNILWYTIYRDSSTAATELPLFWLGDKRLYAYLFFFILGFVIRNKLIAITMSLNASLGILIGSFIVLAAMLFSHFSSWLIVWPYFLCNFFIIVFILYFIAPTDWLQNKYLLFLNKNSLGIYLYHPLIQVPIFYYILHDNQHKHTSYIQAITIFVVVLLGTIALIWGLKKWKFSSKYFLGNIN